MKRHNGRLAKVVCIVCDIPIARVAVSGDKRYQRIQRKCIGSKQSFLW